MAATQTDQGVLRKGRSGLPSGCKIDLLWAIIDSDRGIAICEVCDTNTGELLSCERLDKVTLRRPQAVLRLHKVRQTLLMQCQTM